MSRIRWPDFAALTAFCTSLNLHFFSSLTDSSRAPDTATSTAESASALVKSVEKRS